MPRLELNSFSDREFIVDRLVLSDEFVILADDSLRVLELDPGVVPNPSSESGVWKLGDIAVAFCRAGVEFSIAVSVALFDFEEFREFNACVALISCSNDASFFEFVSSACSELSVVAVHALGSSSSSSSAVADFAVLSSLLGCRSTQVTHFEHFPCLTNCSFVHTSPERSCIR